MRSSSTRWKNRDLNSTFRTVASLKPGKITSITRYKRTKAKSTEDAKQGS